MSTSRESAELLGDNVVQFPARGRKRQPIHWAGQDYATFLEWAFGVRRRAQAGMEIHQAVDESSDAITADRLSKSGKGKRT